MRSRRLDPVADLPRLDELIRLIATCDGHAPIGEHKYLDLVSGGLRSGVDLVFETPDEGLAAYVTAKPAESSHIWAMEVALHPLRRDDRSVDEVIRAGVEEVQASGARSLRAWAFTSPVVSALRRAGFESERELRQLRRPLPIDREVGLPDGITVRPFEPDDTEPWLRVNNAAFASHPENGSWTRDILDDRRRQPWFDPDGFRLAFEDGRLVAFCWTKMHDRGVGEIYVIGVDPAEQGRGLGRSMVIEGLRWMSDVAGASEAMLYVDADNRPALALYDQLGFELDHVDRSFVLHLTTG